MCAACRRSSTPSRLRSPATTNGLRYFSSPQIFLGELYRPAWTSPMLPKSSTPSKIAGSSATHEWVHTALPTPSSTAAEIYFSSFDRNLRLPNRDHKPLGCSHKLLCPSRALLDLNHKLLDSGRRSLDRSHKLLGRTKLLSLRQPRVPTGRLATWQTPTGRWLTEEVTLILPG